jgi:PAS domain S-box-containing protein
METGKQDKDSDTASMGGAESDKAELYLRLQLKNTLNKVLILNEAGCIEYCSDSFLRLSGFEDSAPLKGLHCSAFFEIIGNHILAESAAQSFQNLRKDRKYITSDVRIAFPGAGGTRAYSIQYIPLMDDENFVGAQMLFYDITELKRSESDEYTRIMLEATPIACILWDADGNIVDCNQEMLRMVGIAQRPDSFDTERFFKTVPLYQPDGSPTAHMIRRVIHSVLKTGYERVEWMFRTYKGESLPMESTVVRVPWQDSYRVAAYCYDLREIKEGQRKMRESEERVQIMLDSLPISCTFWDKEGHLIDCNRTAIEFFECESKQEYLDKFYTLSPEYQPDGLLSVSKAKAIIREAYEKGYKSFKWEHVTAKGNPLPGEIYLRRVKWKDEYRVAGYLRDMRAVRTLENDLVRMSSVLEVSPNLALYVGADRQIEYLNPSVSRVSGFSSEELLADGLNLIFDEEDILRLEEAYSPYEPDKQRFDIEMGLICKNGEKRTLLASVFTIVSPDGTPDMGITARDITEIKRIQKELMEAKLHAEQYSRAKSNFLSRMSHEMRTPLNVITGMTDIAETADDSRRKYCLDKIDESANRLLSMIDDILDMAKIDMGTFGLFEEECGFREILRSTVAEISPLAAEKKLAFSVEADENIPERLVTDKRRLRQVMTRLLSNAVKFTPENGAISLSAKRLEDVEGKCAIRIEVADTGIGISPEQQEHLWEAFEQADSGTTRTHGGAGVSLAIVKRFIEMMDGDIRVESECGKGSLFVCTIGVDGQIPALSQPEDAIHYFEETHPDFSDRRILIVDDIEINREIIIALLEDSGATLDSASNGAEALNKFSESVYDLVLMDLHMPVMDGFEAARRIRMSGLPGAEAVRIIAVTADTGGDVINRCFAAGMNGHTGKPITYEALMRTLTRHLTRKSA